MAGDIIVQNNEIAYQGDDGINVSPSPQSIESSSAEKIGFTTNCTPNPRDSVVQGDVVALFDADTHLSGTARISRVDGSACGPRGAVTLTLACEGAANCRAVGALKPGDNFVDLTQQAVARYSITHNDFHENRGQGTQVGAPYGQITGNTYFRNSMGALNVDGLAAGHVLILDNKMK